MKLQQLRYLVEVADRGLNVSEAAVALHTSQPGVSKQVRLLEDELGVTVFERNGKRLTGVSEPGKAVLEIARRILREAENLKRAGAEYSGDAEGGGLTIATTHTQARYVLPEVVRRFMVQHPRVRLNLRQGNPQQVAAMAVSGEADIAIATEALDQYAELATLPCYQWNHCAVAPAGHPVFRKKPLTLRALANFPLVTYDFSFAGRSHINQAFARQDLSPNVVLTAIDADVIKTYVRLGLGVGLIARMAWEPERDGDLQMADCSHLFESNTTRIGVRRGLYLRGYEYDFIAAFAPQLSRAVVYGALRGDGDSYQL